MVIYTTNKEGECLFGAYIFLVVDKYFEAKLTGNFVICKISS
jgi:hypothetical protein